MRSHVPACERTNQAARLRLIHDGKVAPGGGASEDTETIRCVGAAAPTEYRAFEEIFNFLGSDPMPSQMVEVVIIPLEFNLVHTSQCIDIVNLRQAASVSS